MTLRQYITVMFLATVFCWIAWWFVLINVNPFQGDSLGFFFFYLSLFLALMGSISILSFLGRRFLSRTDAPMFRYVQKSFRDAVFFGIVIVVLMFLQGLGYLKWWNIGIFALLLIFALALIATKQKPDNSYLQ